MKKSKLIDGVYFILAIACFINILHCINSYGVIYNFEKIIIMLSIVGLMLQVIFLFFIQGEKRTLGIFNFFCGIAILVTFTLERSARFHYLSSYGLLYNYIVNGVIFLTMAFFVLHKEKDLNTKKKDIISSSILSGIIIAIIFIAYSGVFAEPFDSSIAQKYIDSKGMISAENRKCIWLEDGKVKSCGLSTDEQREVSKWKNVIKVDSGEGTFYGLAANGKVFCTDNNDFDKSEVSLWKEVKDISASKDFVAGLTNQGTIVLAGDFDKSLLQGSKNSVIQIETLDEGIAMLDKSGKVTVLGNIAEQFNRVKEWNDILYISGGSTHLVGITKDGKVVADGEGFFGQCDVNGMENITFAYAGKYDTVLVLTNGKCFAVGKNKKRLSHLMKESQITAIDESEKELAILDKNRKLKVINDN